jgi:hypothetical protein
MMYRPKDGKSLKVNDVIILSASLEPLRVKQVIDVGDRKARAVLSTVSSDSKHNISKSTTRTGTWRHT